MDAIMLASKIPVLLRNVINDEKELNISIVEGFDKSQEKFFIFNSISIAEVWKMIHIFI